MRRFLIALLLLIAFLLPALLWTSHSISRIAEEAALLRLTVATQQLKRDILSHVAWFSERLGIAAILLSEENKPLDAPDIRHLLGRLSQQRNPPVGRLRILLPDGRTVHPDAIMAATPETRAAFEEKARRAPFLSHLEPDPDGDAQILHYYVPIMRGEKTLGLLAAAGSSDNIPQFLRLKNMSRDYQIFIIEGKSGEFLVDTWHKKLGRVLLKE